MKLSRRAFIADSVATLVAAAWGNEGETKRIGIFKDQRSSNTSFRGNEGETKRIGIFTDTHLGYKLDETALRLEQCYRLFKSKHVDMIFNLGDICEWHNPAWYEKYVEIREKVYPEGLPPEIYVFATHDHMKAKEIPGDSEYAKTYEAVREMLKIAHDRYFRFEVCGFTFLVYPQSKNHELMASEIDAECKSHPGRPLFVLDHVPPANTVCGSLNDGNHLTRGIFDKHPEVIALTGHVHGSLAHEGKIWQGAFTAVNFGTIKNPACSGGDWHVAVMDLSPSRAVIHRYEIEKGGEIDSAHPWTLDFPFDPARAPYSPENRRKTVPTPAFAAGASLDVRRLGKPLRAVSVTWPAASTLSIGHYLVAVEKKVGDGWEPRSVLRVEADYIRPAAKRSEFFTRQFRSGYFDAGEKVRIAVTPVDFFGTEGVPLVHELEIGETERWQTLYAGVPDPATSGAFRSFKGNTWFKVPSEALDVPPGTPCRMTIEASLDLPEGMVARFKLRTDKSVIYAHQGYLYTPQGKSSRRYVVEFPRPEPTEEPFNLFLQRAAHGKIRFDGFRIEARKAK